MADIYEDGINNNDNPSQSQVIYSTGFNPSIEIIGFASKTGDNDYYKYLIGSTNRSKFSISLTYSDYSQYQQPFNPKKPVLVRDIFKYTASISSKHTGVDFISNSQSTSSIFVDNDAIFSRDPIVFYTEKLMYDFYINVFGIAGTEGDTKLPQQYYRININKLNGPVGELSINGEIGFSKTITADSSKVSDLDGIKIGSEKIEWFRGQNLISTGKDLILSNDLAFESIYYKFSYIDNRGDNEYVFSNAVKPEVIIDPLKITITQNNQLIILGNDFNYTASKIFIFQGETLISEVDNISDFKISKSYVGSELNLIVAASDGKFYKSTTLKISNINLPALRNGTPLLDVVEADKEGIYSTYFDNRTIVDDDGMSYTTGSFSLYIDGESSQQLTARENTYARDYGIRPLNWLQTSFNFQDAHVGKNYEVIFSFVDNSGNSEKVVLNKGKVLNLNDKPTGLLSITDIASQGQTLNMINSLSDDDGLGTFSYQWQSNGISIVGATGSSYTLKQAEVGKVITVVASYTDLHGTAESVASGPTASVANVNDAPTGSVTIMGTATQGQVLSATNSLADVDGIPTTGTSAISYQWLAAGVNISGATSSTLTLTQAQVGKAISIKASYIDIQGTAESVASSATAFVANINDIPAATAGSVTTNEDTAKTGTLAGTDVDSDTLTFAKVTDPTNGKVSINSTTGAYTYTPDANFNGSDSFTFRVNDGTVDSAVATVSITVAAVNDPPVATSSSISTTKGTAKSGMLSGTDIDSNTLSFAKVADPINGTLSINTTTGAYTYAPKAGFIGSDSFTFKVNDGSIDSGVTTVSVEVKDNSPPKISFWNNAAVTPTDSGKSTAIDLSDAIAILKMIVGLNVNANGIPLSPYQSLAADFNQNGEVGLDDAIGVLKKIVGLSSPEPEWKFFDNSKVKISLTASESLSPKTWIDDAGITELLSLSSTVNVIGVLIGDVNGNWI